MKKDNINRRGFLVSLSLGALALALVPAKAVLAAIPEALKGKKILDVESKVAKRLKYVAQAKESTHKKYKAGQQCNNCTFYKKPIEGYGKCSLAGNRYVSGEGWCKQYRAVKKSN